MKINPQMFRGYDLRGIVGTDLNAEIVEHIGKAFGTYLKRQGISGAVVGQDSRATSPEYSSAIIRGMSWAGVDTIDIGMTMVGTFYWSQYHLNRKGGVFITASHNPAEYNGMKFANDFSETLVSEGMNELRRMVQEDDIEKGEQEGKTEKKDILGAYIEDLSKRLNISKKFRVVVDASCATPGVVAPKILRSFGMDAVESNCNLDPTFPLGTPDPTETAVAERLKAKVLEEKADVGFSYDADGDRIGIVDEKAELSGTMFWWRSLQSMCLKNTRARRLCTIRFARKWWKIQSKNSAASRSCGGRVIHFSKRKTRK